MTTTRRGILPLALAFLSLCSVSHAQSWEQLQSIILAAQQEAASNAIADKSVPVFSYTNSDPGTFWSL